ncbi:MAG: alkaline phosphatase family protein, partial [Planctomycetota bacterium]
KILLAEGQWSRWIKLDFEMSMPAFVPNNHVSGICRFYLQEVSPNLRLYASPINSDPSDSALKLAEPPEFVKKISDRLGLFYTTGFQEDHKALSNKVFSDEEFRIQAGLVLDERIRLLEYALENYDDGLLFFYFSSTDLQSHMFWWDSDLKHPTRNDKDAGKYFQHIGRLYRRFDSIVGSILKQYGDKATIIVMSDHGFANFRRQFNLNTWLRQQGYLYPPEAKSLLADVDWSKSRAYGLGINGLYLNLKGRERDGIVKPGEQYNELLEEISRRLESVRDVDGRRVITRVHRSDEVYSGPATALAPDLIVGYSRDYRASWATCLGGMTEEILTDNTSAWSGDHCADVSEVPGVFFCNRPISMAEPALIDIAPTVLAQFGLKIPGSMQGRNILQ